MAFKITRISKAPQNIRVAPSPARLYKDPDGNIVPDGRPDARWLYACLGAPIPEDIAAAVQKQLDRLAAPPPPDPETGQDGESLEPEQVQDPPAKDPAPATKRTTTRKRATTTKKTTTRKRAPAKKPAPDVADFQPIQDNTPDPPPTSDSSVSAADKKSKSEPGAAPESVEKETKVRPKAKTKESKPQATKEVNPEATKRASRSRKIKRV